jgi:hypothetical protein
VLAPKVATRFDAETDNGPALSWWESGQQEEDGFSLGESSHIFTGLALLQPAVDADWVSSAEPTPAEVFLLISLTSSTAG